MNRLPCLSLLALSIALGFSGSALAAEASTAAADKKVFTLGQITVTAAPEDETPLGTATVSSEQMWDFNRDSLPEALNLIPGLATTPGSGQRNETVISVRGFDRWQVPLMMDGIRLYLPADNRIDFDRFLTPDLAEIQVSKGYVSVLNGPDGMGGAINLVTRKPVKPFEAELRSSAAFSNDGDYNGNTTYASVGSRQEMYYVQGSVEQRDSRSWSLSDDFTPTARENGGKRDNTSKKDWRVNLKAALTPNATDEYSLNFVKQAGEKQRASPVIGSDPASWNWPQWDSSSVYWLSHTQLGSKSYLKTRAYYNTFDNTLELYSTGFASLDTSSYYDDNAKGASVEFGTDLIPHNTLKTSVHYRRDEHTEWQDLYSQGITEPKQDNIESTWSFALENTWHITPALDVILGISRDIRHTKKAEDYASNALVTYRISDNDATNYQGAVIWRYRDSGKLHFSASDRTRFPTVFERFSTRFNQATSNPFLKPERALNLELGIEDTLAPGILGSAAIFHSRVDDVILSVPGDYNGNGTIQTNENQNQNVGKATYQGIELSLTARLSPQLEVGGNYTYLDTDLDNPNVSGALLSDPPPRNKSFLYAKWRPTEKLTVIPSLEVSDNRWSKRAVNSSLYTQTGAYELLGLKLEYKLTPSWDVSLTGRNLLDKNYEVVDGYPQEGRNFVLATRLQF